MTGNRSVPMLKRMEPDINTPDRRVIPFLLALGLLFCALAIKLLLWAIDSGQYDDLEGDGNRILMDDDDPMMPDKKPKDKEPGDKKQPGVNWPDAD